MSFEAGWIRSSMSCLIVAVGAEDPDWARAKLQPAARMNTIIQTAFTVFPPLQGTCSRRPVLGGPACRVGQIISQSGQTWRLGNVHSDNQALFGSFGCSRFPKRS